MITALAKPLSNHFYRNHETDCLVNALDSLESSGAKIITNGHNVRSYESQGKWIDDFKHGYTIQKSEVHIFHGFGVAGLLPSRRI